MSKKRTLMDHNPNYSTDGNEDSEAADQNVDGK